MSKSKILFIMTGSIACYKACQVISRLMQGNCEVQVVATPAALRFVGNATFEGLTGKTVISDMYAPGSVMDHIHLMRWADLILVAPATANFINKAAQGIADDLVSTLFLAHDFKKPFLVAPAMNTSMYQHPTTQESLKKLTAMGIELLDTAAGILACGEEGYGRLLEPDLILDRTLKALAVRAKNPLSGSSSLQSGTAKATAIQAPKILVTSGGTQEPIDTVRVLTNLSSGRTGVALAEAFQELGCEVLLLRAHGSQKSEWLPRQEVFTDFHSLQSQLRKYLGEEEFSQVIHLAAVSDYSVDFIEADGQKVRPLEVKKLNSDSPEMILHLKRNPKLVAHLREYSSNKNIQVVAFKLTSQADPIARTAAVQKLFNESPADFVVHNDLSEIDIRTKIHKFTLHSKDGKQSCEGVDALTAALSAQFVSGGKK